MMMLPASTCSPPKRFTPSRLEWDSRPFLVLPPAFLCAMCASACADVRHPDLGEQLPVTLLPQVMLAASELHHGYLGALAVANHGGDHFAPRNQRVAELHVGAFAHEQYLAELDRGAGLGVELLDAQHTVFADAILLSAGGDHCVHRGLRRTGVWRKAAHSTGAAPAGQTPAPPRCEAANPRGSGRFARCGPLCARPIVGLGPAGPALRAIQNGPGKPLI